MLNQEYHWFLITYLLEISISGGTITTKTLVIECKEWCRIYFCNCSSFSHTGIHVQSEGWEWKIRILFHTSLNIQLHPQNEWKTCQSSTDPAIHHLLNTFINYIAFPIIFSFFLSTGTNRLSVEELNNSVQSPIFKSTLNYFIPFLESKTYVTLVNLKFNLLLSLNRDERVGKRILG